MEKYKEDKVPITYIDEGGFAYDMPRTHGYSSMENVVLELMFGMQRVIAALSGASVIGCGIVEGNIDTAVFNVWVEKV